MFWVANFCFMTARVHHLQKFEKPYLILTVVSCYLVIKCILYYNQLKYCNKVSKHQQIYLRIIENHLSDEGLLCQNAKQHSDYESLAYLGFFQVQMMTMMINDLTKQELNDFFKWQNTQMRDRIIDWMNEWPSEWNYWIIDQMNEWRNNQWPNEWKKEWMKEWPNEWMYTTMDEYCCVLLTNCLFAWHW